MGDRKLTTNKISNSSETSAAAIGREQLKGWLASKPDNFFAYDVGFQRSLEFLWGREDYRQYAGQLYQFGEVLANVVDDAAQEANLEQNLPSLKRYDGVGERISELVYHPSHHVVGRNLFGSGILSAYEEPGNNLLSLSLFYLSSQNGEAGHNCSIACTAGLIKVLQAVGDEKLQNEYLRRLLDEDYELSYQGAQYLTEVQGGSDVGANAVTADLHDKGRGEWLLNGEKWFCSNVSADLALVTARVDGQGDGTKGLGLFLLPRRLENGNLNTINIRRLKDKLGTRSLATGEIELRNAVGYEVGPPNQGFKNVMSHVINTSRIYNAMAVAGNSRRAFITAQSYAKHRSAFGQSIIRFPIVQDLLANMRAETAAILSGTLHIVKLMDDLEVGKPNEQAAGFLRLAINLNKYRSAVIAHDVIVRSIELLGGNGTIETFSILPRLLRDNIVYENWEGTHNVLLSQAQRDIRRYGIAEPFFETIRAMYNRLNTKQLHDEGMEFLNQFVAELHEVLAMDELTAAIYFRPLMDRLTDLYYAGCLAIEAEWEVNEKHDRTKLRLAELFFDRHVARKEPKDLKYYDDRVSRLCQ
jgi:alkylation response protein AidB-like acyl-CoA dehydrogenase